MPETVEYARQARYRYRPGSRCDHDSVLQIYSTEDKILFCDGCGQPNRFLYACTADTPNFSSFDLRRNMPSNPEGLLSPQVRQDIAAGHYTEEQVTNLIEQKINVLNQIENDVEKAFAEPRSTSNAEAYMLLQRQSVQDWVAWMMNQQGVINDGGVLPNLNDYITYMPCQIRLCAVCQEHRNMAQKSFQSLDEVLNEPGASHFPLPEYLNCPVTPAHIAANYPQGRKVQSDSAVETETVEPKGLAELVKLTGLEDLVLMEGLDLLEGLDAWSTSGDAGSAEDPAN